MPFNLANKFQGTKSDNKNWQQNLTTKLATRQQCKAAQKNEA